MSDRHIARQIEIIDELDRDGHPTLLERELLHTYRMLRDTHVAHCDTIRKNQSKAASVGGFFRFVDVGYWARRGHCETSLLCRLFRVTVMLSASYSESDPRPTLGRTWTLVARAI